MIYSESKVDEITFIPAILPAVYLALECKPPAFLLSLDTLREYDHAKFISIHFKNRNRTQGVFFFTPKNIVHREIKQWSIENQFLSLTPRFKKEVYKVWILKLEM